MPAETSIETTVPCDVIKQNVFGDNFTSEHRDSACILRPPILVRYVVVEKHVEM